MSDLTPERWHQIEDLHGDALDLPEHERKAFLDEACAGDAALRDEVQRLLSAESDNDGFLVGIALEDLGPEAISDMLEHLEDAFQPGSTIGRYEVIRRIGAGGMGAVYLARRADGQFARHVAVKVVKRGMDTDEILTQFRSERQLLARLEHPHIARLYDGGVTDNGLPYIAMEYVEGEPIDVYCDRLRLSVDERLALFETVCEAVHYAHSLVVHRDLKPGNVLVGRDGDVKLLDFGIAKLIDTTESTTAVPMTQMEQRRFTPEYAAPEQITGDPVTPATDVYALGMILYEFLSGHRPYRFENRSFTEIESKILHKDPRSPSRQVHLSEQTSHGETITPQQVSIRRNTQPGPLRKKLAGDLDAIVLKALSKEPERRYDSVAGLLDDIRRYRAGYPVAVRPPTLAYRAAKFTRRYKGVVVATAFAFFFLTAGLITSVVGFTRATENRERSESLLGYFVNVLKEGAVDSYDQEGARLGATFTMPQLVEVGLSGLDGIEHQMDRARFSRILGDLALTHGQLREAEQAYLAAHTLEQESGEHDAGQQAASLSDIALIDFNYAGQFDDPSYYARSDSLSREAYALLVGSGQKTLVEGMPEAGSLEEATQLITTLNQWGRTLSAYGRTIQSVDTLRQALRVHQQAIRLGRSGWGDKDSLAVHLADAHLGIAKYRMELGGLLRASSAAASSAEDTLKAARDSYQEAIAIQERSLGREHPMVGSSYNDFSYLLYQLGETERAIDHATRALDIAKVAYLRPHRAQAYLYMALGLYTKESDPERAAAYYEEALSQFEQLDGFEAYAESARKQIEELRR